MSGLRRMGVGGGVCVLGGGGDAGGGGPEGCSAVPLCWLWGRGGGWGRGLAGGLFSGRFPLHWAFFWVTCGGGGGGMMSVTQDSASAGTHQLTK